MREHLGYNLLHYNIGMFGRRSRELLTSAFQSGCCCWGGGCGVLLLQGSSQSSVAAAVLRAGPLLKVLLEGACHAPAPATSRLFDIYITQVLGVEAPDPAP